MDDDLKLVLSVGGYLTGVVGLLLGYFSYRNSSREKRLEALSLVLQAMLDCLQELNLACTNREESEKLHRAFPDPAKAPEAVKRHNDLVDSYSSIINRASDKSRESEVVFGAHQFRFPDKIATRLKIMKDRLLDIGRKLNNGHVSQARLEITAALDDYKYLKRYGRGMRLVDPFEGLWRHVSKYVSKEEGVQEISQERMDQIINLVHVRASSQAHNSFVVHPPEKLLQWDDINEIEDVVSELDDAPFNVVFQDGTSDLMNIVELLVFNYNIIFIAIESQKIAEAMRRVEKKDVKFEIKTNVNIEELKRPEMAKFLLSKINFDSRTCDSR